MRRISILTVAVGTLLAAALVVSVENSNDLRGDLRWLRERLARTETSLAVTSGARRQAASDAAANKQAAERRRKRIDDLLARLDTATITLERRAALARALVPPGRSVFEARLLRGHGGDLLVIQWHQSQSGVTFTGIDVWHVSVANDGPSRWDLVYVLEPHPDFEAYEENSYLLIGPPETARRAYSEYGPIRVDIAATGDATGDGLPDVAVQDMGSGSGGCGTVWLLQNLGTTVRDTFHRNGCIHSLAIEDGRLVYADGFHNSCRLDKRARCVARTTWLQWTGSSWVVSDVERDVY